MNREAFEERVVSRSCDIPGPPRSLGTSPTMSLKFKVYHKRPRTIPEMKEPIHSVIVVNSGAIIKNVMRNLSDHLQECNKFEGRLVSEVIFNF